jgi:hypothetical protein
MEEFEFNDSKHVGKCAAHGGVDETVAPSSPPPSEPKSHEMSPPRTTNKQSKRRRKATPFDTIGVAQLTQPSLPTTAWTSEMDAKLRDFVGWYGDANWTGHSKALGGAMSAEQCSERWFGKLRCEGQVKKGLVAAAARPRAFEWSESEELLLAALFLRLGRTWGAIATLLQTNRSASNVRDRFYRSVRGRIIEKLQRGEAEHARGDYSRLDYDESVYSPTHTTEEWERLLEHFDHKDISVCMEHASMIGLKMGTSTDPLWRPLLDLPSSVKPASRCLALTPRGWSTTANKTDCFPIDVSVVAKEGCGESDGESWGDELLSTLAFNVETWMDDASSYVPIESNSVLDLSTCVENAPSPPVYPQRTEIARTPRFMFRSVNRTHQPTTLRSVKLVLNSQPMTPRVFEAPPRFASLNRLLAQPPPRPLP